MGAPLPWFPFFVDAWDTDATVRQMSMAERGVYVSLLCWQWREGFVPNDPKAVAKALGCSRPLVDQVLAKGFPDDGSGEQRLVNRKLNDVLAQQVARSEKAATAGRASAASRAGKSLHRSRIRTEIHTSLESSTKPNGNGHSPIVPVPKPGAKKLPTETQARAAWKKPDVRETA